jgi:glutamate dehydrogenase
MVRRNETGALSVRIERRKAPLQKVDSDWLGLLSSYDRRRAEARIKRFVKAGIPGDLAADVALLRSRASGFDVIALAENTNMSVRKAAALFYEVSGRFKIDRIRAALIANEGGTHWEKLALRHLQEDFFSAQARFAQSAAEHHVSKGGGPDETAKTIIQNWVKDKVVGIKPYEEAVNSMSRAGSWTVSKFAIVNAQLRDLLPNSP